MDPGEGGGRDKSGVEGGEAVVGMYCMGEKSIFNKKKPKTYCHHCLLSSLLYLGLLLNRENQE